MSIDPNQITKQENLPPYPVEKEDTVTPPLEHRDEHSVFDKIRLALRTKMGKVAVVAGGAALAVSTYAAVKGGEKSPEPKTEPSASAPANPGETQAPQATPEVGVANNTLAGLNVPPSEEVYQEALEGVPDSLSPEEAFKALESLLAVEELGGEVDEVSEETPESIARRDALRDVMYSDKSGNVFNDENDLRSIIAASFKFVEEARPGKTGTWSHDWDIISIEETGDNEWTAHGVSKLQSNLDQLDPMIKDNINNYDQSVSGLDLSISITKESGSWKILHANIG